MYVLGCAHVRPSSFGPVGPSDLTVFQAHALLKFVLSDAEALLALGELGFGAMYKKMLRWV